MNLNVKFMISDIPTVLSALPVTLELTFASLFFAILLAVLFGVCILKKIPVLKQLVPFVKHVQARVRAQGKRLGFYPEQEPRTWQKGRAIGLGLGVYAMSQFWPSRSTLDKSYLRELGFEPERAESAPARRS